MKRLLVVVAVVALLAPSLVFAASNDVCVLGPTTPQDVCWSPSGEEITAQEYFRDQSNAGVCTSVGLPVSCTQAEYDAVDPTPPAAVVYANTTAGTRAFYSAKMKEASLKDLASYDSEYKGRGSNVWNQASEAQRQAMCTAGGADANCVLP